MSLIDSKQALQIFAFTQADRRWSHVLFTRYTYYNTLRVIKGPRVSRRMLLDLQSSWHSLQLSWDTLCHIFSVLTTRQQWMSGRMKRDNEIKDSRLPEMPMLVLKQGRTVCKVLAFLCLNCSEAYLYQALKALKCSEVLQLSRYCTCKISSLIFYERFFWESCVLIRD